MTIFENKNTLKIYTNQFKTKQIKPKQINCLTSIDEIHTSNNVVVYWS